MAAQARGCVVNGGVAARAVAELELSLHHHSHHVRFGIDDPADKGGEFLEGNALFVIVFVPIIGPTYSAYNVAQTKLGMIAGYASARHETARCTSQIVDNPASDTAIRV